MSLDRQSVMDTDTHPHSPDDDDPWLDFEDFVLVFPTIADKYYNHLLRERLVASGFKKPPFDLRRHVNTPKDLNEDELNIIAPGIAHIVLQGFCDISWLELSYYSHIDDTLLALFRKKLFVTLAKLVLTLFDLEDFHRCADEADINLSCILFGDHLSTVYGTQPESLLRTMTDISQGNLDFSQFPFLRERDVNFTLEHYQMECSKAEWFSKPENIDPFEHVSCQTEKIDPPEHHNQMECSKIEKWMDPPKHVFTWPFVSSPMDKECKIHEVHLKSVREALSQYVPLTENERIDLMMEMEQEPLLVTIEGTDEKNGCLPRPREPWSVEPYPTIVKEIEVCGPLMEALCSEPWKDIKPDDLDAFNTPEGSTYIRNLLFPHRLFAIFKKMTLKKATQVRLSKKYVTFPLRSGVWGDFTDEVLEVVEIANLTRMGRGQQFLSADLILSVILQSRIADMVNTLLSEQSPPCRSKEFIDMKYPIYYICSLANDVARILDSGRTSVIKLEHVVLAIVFGGLHTMDEDWKMILGRSSVVQFLEECDRVCASGSSPPLSPKKKKLKYSCETDHVPVSRYSWADMESLIKALESDECFDRVKIFERVRAKRQERSVSSFLKLG